MSEYDGPIVDPPSPETVTIPKADLVAIRDALEPFAEYYDLNDCAGRIDTIEVPTVNLATAKRALTKLDGYLNG